MKRNTGNDTNSMMNGFTDCWCDRKPGEALGRVVLDAYVPLTQAFVFAGT